MPNKPNQDSFFNDPFSDDGLPPAETRTSIPQRRGVLDSVRNALDRVRAQLNQPQPPTSEPYFSHSPFDDDTVSAERVRLQSQKAQARQELVDSKRKRRRLAGIATTSLVLVSSAALVAKNLIDDEPKNTPREATEQQLETTTQPEDTEKSQIEMLQTVDPSVVSIELTPDAELRPNQLDADLQLNGTFDQHRCESVNVSLPVEPTMEGIQKGSEIDFALDLEEFQLLKDELLATQTIEDAQAIVRRVLSAYRINVTFDETSTDSLTPPNEYSRYLAEYMRALTMLPADMFNLTTTHELQILSRTQITVTDLDAAGVYNYGSVQVELPYGPYVAIHEWGHALQDYVCHSNMWDDQGMEEAYDQIIANISSDSRYAELNMKYDASLYGTYTMTNEELSEYFMMHALAGLPNSYAGRNSLELFAVVFEHLVVHGYQNYGVEGDKSAIELVQEAVIERMQAAMPDVDVGAWLQFVSFYYRQGLTPDVISPEEIGKLHISVFDTHLQRFLGNQEQLGRYPAVAIANGENIEFIYATYNPLSGEVVISFQETGVKNLDEKLKEAATNYLLAISTSTSTPIEEVGRGAAGSVTLQITDTSS